MRRSSIHHISDHSFSIFLSHSRHQLRHYEKTIYIYIENQFLLRFSRFFFQTFVALVLKSRGKFW